jgi:peptide/nickel transport system permease protein
MVPKLNSPFIFFILRKIIVYTATFFIAITLAWLLPHIMPGDPIRELTMKIVVAGTKGGGAASIGLTEEQVKKLYTFWVQKFGLDQPLHVQYLLFLKQVFTLDLGVSIRYYPSSVVGIISRALPWSLGLLIPAAIVGWILGNLLGALAAYKKGIFDRVLYPFFLFVSQSPQYWLALILIYILGFYLKIFPLGRAYTMTLTPSFSLEFIMDVLLHSFLPFLSVVMPYIGGEAIGMRSLMLYEINSDYANYVETLGFKDWKILVYSIKNAFLPQVTGLPLYFASAFGGQLVVEAVFGYPGIGSILYDAVIGQDYPLTMGCFLAIITVTLVGNLFMDILYVYLDPRIRTGYLSEG